MNTNAPIALAGSQPANVVPLPTPRFGRIPKPENASAQTHRQRFRILEFRNTGGSIAYRVQGMTRDGNYIRQNYASLKEAQCRQIELEADYLKRQPEDPSIRATRLSDTQLRIAEAAFHRLDSDDELLLAVNHWLQHGRNQNKVESPRLDEAAKQFKAWLAGSECPLRERTRANLRLRLNAFATSVGNLRVADFTPDLVEGYLAKRNLSPASKDNDRRAVSRFFSWCIQRPRRWAAANPCREVRVARGEKAPPAILTLQECKKLMNAAKVHRRGRLVPYTAVCLFGGLRPFEAARLRWEQVNLDDGEIRLEANQTKTKRPRVVAICDTLAAWLKAYRGKPFFPSNWRRDFDTIKARAGYPKPTKEVPEPKPWPEDVLRHTAISHYFRHTGSYGQTAEQFGNSESIIKLHYQGRVSTEDTKRFYRLKPHRRH